MNLYLVVLIIGLAALVGGGGFVAYKISTGGRYNDSLDPFFERYALENKLSPLLLKAIAMNESGLRFEFSDIFEPVGGTQGIMHIQLATARDYEPSLTAKDLQKPENEIRVAAKHVARLLEKYGGDERKVVWAYNAGEGNVTKGRIPPITADYIARFERNKNRIKEASNVA